MLNERSKVREQLLPHQGDDIRGEILKERQSSPRGNFEEEPERVVCRDAMSSDRLGNDISTPKKT